MTGELGSRVEELIFERDGDEVLIKVKVPRNSNGGISSDLSISVPSGSSIHINTVSADIDVSDVDVSMNGIELQDREFLAAIAEGREPNSSVHQVLSCYDWLNTLEQQLRS